MTKAILPLLLAGLGCSGNPTDGPAYGRSPDARGEDVVYQAETAVLESFPAQLRTLVTIANTGSAAVTLTFPDGCIVLLRVYPTPDATAPVFDQGAVRGCGMALQDVRLEPGESVQFETRSDAREILGDRLPDGLYHMRALLRPNGRQVEVPAGAVQLALPRG